MRMGMAVAMVRLVTAMVVTVVTTIGMVTMIVRMVMRMGLVAMAATACIGAAFGIEWRLDLDQARAEPFDQRLDHVIAANAQGRGRDLGRQMAIAKMPGQADQVVRVRSLDLDQGFGCGHHLDQPAVFQHQRIAAAQHDGAFQIEQEG